MTPQLGNLLKSLLSGILLLSCPACLTLPGSGMALEAPSKSCVAATLGLNSDDVFSVFAKKAKQAIADRNWRTLGWLIRYPVEIRVVDAFGMDRRGTIDNRMDFEGSASEIFSPSIRKRVESPGVRCDVGQVEFGGGVLWATYESGVIQIIRIDSPEYRWPGMNVQPLISCRTNSRSLAVDRIDGVMRIRVWKVGAPRSGKPDYSSNGVIESTEGQGVCSRRIWRFNLGAAKFVLTEPGCAVPEGPDGLIGVLTAENGNVEIPESYCLFEPTVSP